MKTKNYLFVFVLAIMAVNLNAQDFTTSVCPNSKGTYEINSPQVGSVYTWSLKNSTGSMSATTGTTITVDWDASQTADLISVSETNAGGCTGAATTIAVGRFAMPNAKFASANLCNGSAPVVNLTGIATFDLSWTEPNSNTVQNSNGITGTTFALPNVLAGTYKLISVKDKNCTLTISNGAVGSSSVVSAPLSKLSITIK